MTNVTDTDGRDPQNIDQFWVNTEVRSVREVVIVELGAPTGLCTSEAVLADLSKHLRETLA